ncbi:MAG: DUF488 domain-containing protein [Saprospiraceae bacterium]|nr:DUF488 domain-containing protein [Saprospiraceae bacterium]
MPKPIIHTIGHSNLAADDFLHLLQAHGIDCVVDVRSTPASQYNPQYNKPALAEFLKENDIVYLHFGKEFGARHTNPKLQDETGKVDFEKVQATADFRLGIERLRQGVDKGYFPALMCAEAEPLDCHRFSMISNRLEQEGFEVVHILKDGVTATHDELEQTLLKKFAKKLPQPTIFEPEIGPKEQLQAAYRLHNQLVGWSQKTAATDEAADGA